MKYDQRLPGWYMRGWWIGVDCVDVGAIHALLGRLDTVCRKALVSGYRDGHRLHKRAWVRADTLSFLKARDRT